MNFGLLFVYQESNHCRIHVFTAHASGRSFHVTHAQTCPRFSFWCELHEDSEKHVACTWVLTRFVCDLWRLNVLCDHPLRAGGVHKCPDYTLNSFYSLIFKLADNIYGHNSLVKFHYLQNRSGHCWIIALELPKIYISEISLVRTLIQLVLICSSLNLVTILIVIISQPSYQPKRFMQSWIMALI